MKRSVIVTTILMVIFTIAGATGAISAGVPNTLNYQGSLTNNTGEPVTGSKQIVFKLYNVVSGGTMFWTETKTVTVTNGNFSVVLGSTTPLNADMFTGDTWLGIKVGTDAEMAPRQKLTSVAYALKAADAIGAVPQGGIIMWSGAANAIPQGWALCDGANGTPNLRDRFVVGAGSATYPVGKTGGAASHTLTVNEMPSHTHPQNAHKHSELRVWTSNSDRSGQDNVDPVRSSQSGSWSGIDGGETNDATATNQNTGGDAAHNNLPPYYALCFIMKL